MDSEPKGKYSLTLQAPIKINWCLRVLGRLANGYHELDMVMVPLTLGDTIEVTVREDIGVTFGNSQEDLPVGPGNTLWKAVQLLEEASGRKFGLDIFLHKNVPVAAGLGGGSSDAAALLKGLNQRLDLNLSDNALHQIAIQIGMDVPFFLKPGVQRALGRGEILSPVTTMPSLSFILVNPGFPVSTPEVYRDFASTTGLQAGERRVNRPWKLPANTFHASPLTANNPDATPAASFSKWIQEFPLENDLEVVVLPRYPVLADIKKKLMDAGALGSLMSGSGPTLFGVFASTTARDQGYEHFLSNLEPAAKQSWWVQKAEVK